MENCFPVAVSLVASGRVKVDHLYSAIMPLEKINDAMNSLLDGTEVGVIIEP
jgi:Zn-dependent alcohol dehydrogenase